MHTMQLGLREENQEKLYKYADEVKFSFYSPEIEDYDDFKDNFSSGNDSIDRKIYDNRYNNNFVDYFVVDNKTDKIIAVYSLACSACIYSDHDKNHFYSAIEIEFFAVDIHYQDIKAIDPDEGCLSSIIFRSILSKIMDMSFEVIGATKIILYSVPNAVSFYQKNGFSEFEIDILKNTDWYTDECIPMYMHIS